MRRTLLIWIVLMVLITVFVTLKSYAQVGSGSKMISYQGHIMDTDGINVNAVYPVEVRLYDSFIAGIGQGIENSHVVYAEIHNAIEVKGGNFVIAIGGGVPVGDKWTELPVDQIVSRENIYLELWIDGERMSPRQKVGSVPATVTAEYSKYADELTEIPDIAPEQMPAYNAEKITSGAFASNQIPTVKPSCVNENDTGCISGLLSPAQIPALSADKFSTSGTLSADRLDSLDASKITGGMVSSSTLPSNLLKSHNIAFRTGTAPHNSMIAVPSGFSKSDCVWVASPSTHDGSVEGIDQIELSVNNDLVVTCRIFESWTHTYGKPVVLCSANYAIFCKKGDA